jgi:hypothetical protein
MQGAALNHVGAQGWEPIEVRPAEAELRTESSEKHPPSRNVNPQRRRTCAISRWFRQNEVFVIRWV